MNKLANGYTAVGRHSDAVKLHEETLALRKAKLGPDHPDTLLSTLSLRKVKLKPDDRDTIRNMRALARSYAALGQHADALKLQEEVLALQKAKFGPNHRDTLMSMLSVAESLIALERGAKAVLVIDEFVQRAADNDLPPLWHRSVMIQRLRHFEKTKDPAGCRQTAEMWEKLNRTDAGSLYNAACNRAVTAEVLTGTKQADAEAEQAMAWLKKAVAAGYKDAAHMQKDKDLDALRHRDDFKKLMAELAAGGAKQK
jgi:hypothetical protein